MSAARMLKVGFFFKPFNVPAQGIALAKADLPADLELLTFQRENKYRALIAREMAYHHVAQGELAGQPYLVSF